MPPIVLYSSLDAPSTSPRFAGASGKGTPRVPGVEREALHTNVVPGQERQLSSTALAVRFTLLRASHPRRFAPYPRQHPRQVRVHLPGR